MHNCMEFATAAMAAPTTVSTTAAEAAQATQIHVAPDACKIVAPDACKIVPLVPCNLSVHPGHSTVSVRGAEGPNAFLRIPHFASLDIRKASEFARNLLYVTCYTQAQGFR